MGQITEVFPSETIENMKQFYQKESENAPQGAIFRARTNNAIITGYKSGKVLFQGAKPELEFNKWSGEIQAVPNKQVNKNPFHVSNEHSYAPPNSLFEQNHVGSDESGTGDFFGPITTCAVYVTEQQIKWLREIGIQDSKMLTDERVKNLADDLIAAKIPYSLMVLRNDRYNELQSQGWSQGKMKAMLHQAVIEKVMEKMNRTDVEGIVIDQFCHPDVYIRHIKSEGRSLLDKSYFMTKAENYSIAVAAGSIIARASFLHEMEKLSQVAGVTLLKGASRKVDQLAANIIRTKGEPILHQIAKVHFATTQKARNLL